MGLEDEDIDQNSPACPASGCFHSMLSSPVLSVHRSMDVLPDRFLGLDMATGAPDEKKKDRSKNKQPQSRVAPAVRQVHVELWDEPPNGDPQEDDTDREPDHV